ncbi:MAG: restriction endonuclease [Firmicutes bacterium]|nr:restriction endonuclease [Bacillota bacterium]
MSQHDLLRTRFEQHKAKNKISKNDDKEIYIAAKRVMDYLEKRFDMEHKYEKYHLEFEKSIKISDMIGFIKQKGFRSEFYPYDESRTINPDGGIIYLVDEANNIKYPLVIAEVKHQGTNIDRIKEGKEKQAVGNAIERLGKNLTAIKAYMHYENITPFVCFGHGCDFAENSLTVLSKVWCLNEFYDINRIFVNKRDNDKDHGGFAPVSMYFREEPWTIVEMFDIMKEIAEYSFRYWLF